MKNSGLKELIWIWWKNIISITLHKGSSNWNITLPIRDRGIYIVYCAFQSFHRSFWDSFYPREWSCGGLGAGGWKTPKLFKKPTNRPQTFIMPAFMQQRINTYWYCENLVWSCSTLREQVEEATVDSPVQTEYSNPPPVPFYPLPNNYLKTTIKL